jgi:hypothetical protein
MNYHIFYNSSKKIIWGSINDTPQSVIDSQAEDGLSHLQITVDTLPPIDLYYVNSEGTGIVAYGQFQPALPATFMFLGGSMSVTNIPEGTAVYVDDTSIGSIDSDETLIITGTNAGTYSFKLTKDNYIDYKFSVLVHGAPSHGT